MNDKDKCLLLAQLDSQRFVFAHGEDVAREFAPDRSECRVVAVRPEVGLPLLIETEKAKAEQDGYRLEWKVYAHDGFARVDDALIAQGFEVEDEEAVLAFLFKPHCRTGEAFTVLPPGAAIARVLDAEGLLDVAAISAEIGRCNVEAETARLGAILKETPEAMTVHVLTVDGEPVSCGRTHFARGGLFAELAGGRTKTLHRGRGYFRALVEHRLQEARRRGSLAVLVDALPTSEPILRRLGFELLTRTRPFIYEPPRRG